MTPMVARTLHAVTEQWIVDAVSKYKPCTFLILHAWCCPFRSRECTCAPTILWIQRRTNS